MKTLQEYGIVELRDGLTLEILKEKYRWILKAKISFAIIGMNEYGIVWYGGLFKNGTWKNGTFRSGTFKNGIWHGGLFENGVFENGIWWGGLWKNGLWKGGDVWNYVTKDFEYLETRVQE